MPGTRNSARSCISTPPAFQTMPMSPKCRCSTNSTLLFKEISDATHGNVWVDIKDGYFSNNPGLVGSDFAACLPQRFAGWFSLYPSGVGIPYLLRSNPKPEAMQYLNVDGTYPIPTEVWGWMMTTTTPRITSRSSAAICQYLSTGRCCGCGTTTYQDREILGNKVCSLSKKKIITM